MTKKMIFKLQTYFITLRYTNPTVTEKILKLNTYSLIIISLLLW